MANEDVPSEPVPQGAPAPAPPPGWAPPPWPAPPAPWAGPPPGWAPPPPPAGWPEGRPGLFGPPATRVPRVPPTPPPPDVAPRLLLGLAVAAGVALDIGLRGGVRNAWSAAGLAVTAGALLTSRRLVQPSARRMAALSLVPVAALTLRASPWLAVANLGAATALLVGAVVLGRRGSLADVGPRLLLGRVGQAVIAGLTGPRVLGPALPSRSEEARSRTRAVVRAAAVAVPVLAVVMALLASADPVFAGLITPEIDLGPAFGHLLLAGLATIAVVVAVRSASVDPVDREVSGSFGPLEVLTMLGLTALVLGMFVVSQLLVAVGAADRVLASQGVSPAEYARGGFFQLCWASGILLVFLGAVRSLAAPATFAVRPVRVLAAVVPLLAVGLVVVSLRRMAVYDRAFGLTMLRLSVVVVVVWIGAVLLMVAARNAGLGGGRRWIVAGAGGVGLVLVLAANVADPERFVVEHNLHRARQGAELDVDYLAGLSDDAAPALDRAVRSGDEPDLRPLLASAGFCDDPPQGAASWNVAVQRARAARERLCRVSDRTS